MALPNGVFLIDENNYDPDGLYRMGPGHTFIFKFRVKPFDKTQIHLSHKMDNSQDMTVDVWFSKKPLEPALFVNDPSLNHFKLIRRRRTIEIWDELIFVGEPDKILLPGNVDYYLNIKNLQNSDNGFRLTFDDDCGCDND